MVTIVYIQNISIQNKKDFSNRLRKTYNGPTTQNYREHGRHRSFLKTKHIETNTLSEDTDLEKTYIHLTIIHDSV